MVPVLVSVEELEGTGSGSPNFISVCRFPLSSPTPVPAEGPTRWVRRCVPEYEFPVDDPTCRTTVTTL